MPTWAMSGSQGGARPGSPGVGGPGLQSGPEHPPAGGTAPRRAATGQFGCSRLLPAGMCDRAVLVGDMTTARPGALHPAHTRQAHGGAKGRGLLSGPRAPAPRRMPSAPGHAERNTGPPLLPAGMARSGPGRGPYHRPGRDRRSSGSSSPTKVPSDRRSPGLARRGESPPRGSLPS